MILDTSCTQFSFLSIMMYVFISPHVRIFSANSEKVWNTWAVLKSCEVVQEFAPKLKILFFKNGVSLTEVWAISESCEVVQEFAPKLKILFFKDGVSLTHRSLGNLRELWGCSDGAREFSDVRQSPAASTIVRASRPLSISLCHSASDINLYFYLDCWMLSCHCV